MPKLTKEPPGETIHIRAMQEEDWPHIRAIYLDGIATKNATFQTNAPETWAEWNQRYLSLCRFVATSQDKVLGWAMLSQVSNRTVYRGVAEASIYIAKEVRGKGIGSVLLSALITDSEKNGFWTLQTGIFPENTASLALHKKCGFRKVGVRKKIAQLDGQWRDMLLLERRSNRFRD